MNLFHIDYYLNNLKHVLHIEIDQMIENIKYKFSFLLNYSIYFKLIYFIKKKKENEILLVKN